MATQAIRVAVNPANTDMRYVLWDDGRIDAFGGALPVPQADYHTTTDGTTMLGTAGNRPAPTFYNAPLHGLTCAVRAFQITDWSFPSGYVLTTWGASTHSVRHRICRGAGNMPGSTQILYSTNQTAVYAIDFVVDGGNARGWVLNSLGGIDGFGANIQTQRRRLHRHRPAGRPDRRHEGPGLGRSTPVLRGEDMATAPRRPHHAERAGARLLRAHLGCRAAHGNRADRRRRPTVLRLLPARGVQGPRPRGLHSHATTRPAGTVGWRRRGGTSSRSRDRPVLRRSRCTPRRGGLASRRSPTSRSSTTGRTASRSRWCRCTSTAPCPTGRRPGRRA